MAYPFSAAYSDDDSEEYSEHSEHDFCYDMTCPCHESRVLINNLNEAVLDGEVSVDDANNIYRGRTV